MKDLTIGLLKFYKKFITPVFVSVLGQGCRFTPTCSEYAMQAIGKYGVLKGGKLSLKRVARCHPFSEPSFDPVPTKI